MGLLSPWFLAGVAAVGLPLWLHLLRQFKRTPQPFSSLMFFERRVQSSVRHRRLRYLALLALRIAVLVLLALAFANPYINQKTSASTRRKLTIIAVDRSFSMRYGDRLQKAKSEAEALLRGLRGQELGQVMAVDAHVENLTPPETDRGALTVALESMQPSDQASSFGEFVRALRVTEQTTGMQLNVHFISDMQKTSMPPSFRDLQVGPHTTLALHTVTPEQAPNWAVETVAAPAHVYDTAHTRLTATIAGWQTQPAPKKISVVLDGKVIASKNVSVPAKGRATAEFLAFDVPYGAHRGEVRIEPHDSLPQDDSFPFSVERSDPRKVLYLYAKGHTRDAFYYKAAIESGPETGLTVQTAPVEQAGDIQLSKYAFVVLSDVGDPGSTIAQRLCTYVQHGGAALVALGPGSKYSARVPLSGDRFTEDVTTEGAGYVDRDNAAVRGAGNFENVQFYQAVRVTPKPDARVIAKLSDGSPLLVEERMGEGRILIFASTLDNSTNDFPLHTSFLPFVMQTGRYLSGTEDVPTDVVAGTPVSLRRTQQESTAADVIGPDGKHELSLTDASKALSVDLTRDGFYDVQRADGRRVLMAVHADRRESDLTQTPADTLALWRNTGTTVPEAQAGNVEQQTRPHSFWRIAVALVLLVALVESVFASRYLGEERQSA